MFLFQFGANGIVMGTPVVYDSTGMCTKAKNIEWTVLGILTQKTYDIGT